MTDIDELDALFQEERPAPRPVELNDLLDAVARYVPAHRIVGAVITLLVSTVLFSLVWGPVLNQTMLWLDPPEGYSGFITVAVSSIAVSAVALIFSGIAGGLALANQLRARYVAVIPCLAFAAALFVNIMELNGNKTLAELLPF